MRIKTFNIDFLKWRWHAIGASSLVILAGLVVMLTRGIPLGVEFAGGTMVIVQFHEDTTTDRIEQIREALSANFGGSTIATYGAPSARQVMIRVPEVEDEGDGTELGATADAVMADLRSANLGEFEIVGRSLVSPTVGEELTSRGVSATVLSLLGILIYLTFRYQLSFAMGAVVASLHDLLVTLAFLAFFQYEMTLNVIAAVLTVAGYSGNDTIVVFDRVRENLRGTRRDSLRDVINLAVNQTLARTIITGGLTLLSVLALFFFGGEVLRGFAFTLMVGIITGTYSTVFIAGSIVTFWRQRTKTTTPVRAPASTPAAAQQPARKAKPQRKVRAS
ncbi:MAG: protein translocase subunit SecF [Vicinamibacterales bacterium]